MRKLALDIGDKRIGIAKCDPLGIIVTPMETFVRCGNEKEDIEYLLNIAKEEECDTIVIGLPLNLDGTFGKRATITKEFGDKLSLLTACDIVYQDERLTSVDAEEFLIKKGISRKEKKNYVDKIAAAMILESYLENKKENKKMNDEKNKDLLNEEEEIITLTDENGEEIDFYHVATIDYKEEWYILLSPVNPNEEIGEDEVIIFKLGEDESGNETFNPIENEDELDAVFAEYEKLVDECDCENGDDDCCSCGCKEHK